MTAGRVFRGPRSGEQTWLKKGFIMSKGVVFPQRYKDSNSTPARLAHLAPAPLVPRMLEEDRILVRWIRKSFRSRIIKLFRWSALNDATGSLKSHFGSHTVNQF